MGRSKGTGFTRRTVLAGIGATIVDSAFAGSGLTVGPSEDGGFSVRLDFHEIWKVGRAEVVRGWGPGATVTFAAPQALPGVTIRGHLLGRATELDLSFSTVRRRWACQFRVTMAGIDSIRGGAPFPFAQSPSTSIVSIPVSVSSWSRAAGLPSGTKILHPQFELGHQLEPTLAGNFHFELLRGFKTQGPLQLLPGTTGPLARLIFGRSDVIGLTKGLSLRADQMIAKFPVVPPDYLLLQGAGTLRVGSARFAANANSSIRFFRDPSRGVSWATDWRLPDWEQMIETPQARVNVTGTGESDIDAEGTFHRLHRFSAKAQLGHLALRLPISSKGGRYADLGRLDFKSGAGSRVAFAFGGFSGAASRSRIALEPGDANPAKIQLDNAVLHVAREADMFHGKFSFRGLALKLGRGGPLLVQSTSTPEEHPLLCVDLPSQHIKEQSFFKQLPVLPGRDLKPTELTKLFDLKERDGLRAALKVGDPNFETFATRYEKAYSEYSNAELPAPAESTRRLEMIYVGRDGLFSLRSRRVANELAYKIREEQGIKLEDVKLGLGPILVADILRRRKPDPRQPWQSPFAQQAFQDLLDEAEKRSEDHWVIQKDYRERNPGVGARFYAAAWLDRWPEEYPALPAARPDAPKSTRDELSAMLVVIKRDTAPSPAASQQALSKAYRDEPPNALPVKRKAAGATRLVFDLSTPNKEKPAEKPPTSWHYSLETLLAWDRYDLKVTRRAMRFDVDSDATNTQKLIDSLKSQGINPTDKISTRMALVVKQAERKPDDFETRIELPARLYLSPAGDARFRLRRSSAEGRDRVPVWQAEMHDLPGKRFSLRAVGSPDFEPGAFNRTGKAPLRGDDDFRSTLDKFDRHQLVGLSSVFGLPVIARQSPTDGLEQTSQVLPPEGYKLDDVWKDDVDGQALYVPRPLPHRLLSLSPIGASLDLQAVFVPPASLRDSGANNVFNAFSVERWRSLISFGRDVTTEVVYKGFLYPIGFRATLVKITERVFGPWTDQRRLPVAFLRQRLFIQISNPTKKFPAVNQPYVGRGWPAQSVTLDMDHTPDLLDPVGRGGDRRSTDQAWTEQGSGRLDHALRVGLVFWPRTSPGEAGNIRFRMKIDERPELVSMPLIFVDNEAAHDSKTMRTLRNYYNDDAQVPQRLKLLQHNGVRRRYAPEEKPGDTTFETLEWRVAADCRARVAPGGPDPDDSLFLVDSPMESVDQPPVYPRLRSALIRHDSSSRFSGNAQPPTEVVFYDQYLEREFIKRQTSDKPDPDSTKQAFFIVTSGDAPLLEMGSNGDRSGGVGRPNTPIRAIGRDGPIGGGKPATPPGSKTEPPKFDANFFDPEARVLGIVSLNDLVKNAVAGAGVPPLLKDTFEVACQAVQTGAKAASDELIRIKAKIDGLPQSFRNAYSNVLRLIQQEIEALAPISTNCSPSDVARAVASTRNLIGEVDRLAAAPLAPLTDLVDGALRRSEESLWAGVSGAIETPLQQIAGTIPLNAISDILLPIGKALAAADRLDKLAAIQPGIARAFATASATTFTTRPPAPTLQGLRGLWVKNASHELDSLGAGQPAEVQAEIGALKNVLADFDKAAPPDVLARLYVSATAVITTPRSAWIDVLATQLLAQPVKDELIFWWNRTVLPKCTDLVDGVRALRLALVARAFDLSVCKNADLCVAGKSPPGGGTDGLCLLLWRLCQDLPTLSPASTELAKAYAALATAAAELVKLEDASRAKCGNPAEFDQIRRDLTRGLHRVGAARDEFVNRLLTWANALGTAAFDRLTQEAVVRVGGAAAKAIGTLVPLAADLGAFVDQLTPLVGETTAKEIKQNIDATIVGWRAQADAFTSATTRDNLRTTADQFKTAIAALADQTGKDTEKALTEAMLRSALPAIAAAEDLLDRLLGALKAGYVLLLPIREQLRATLDQLQGELERTLGIRLTGGQLRKVVDVDVDPALRPVCTGVPVETEGLKQEAETISCLAGLGKGASRLDAVLRLLQVWSAKDPAAVRLVTGLSSRAKQLLSLPPQLQIVDVDDLRQKLSDLLQDVVPTKRHLAYSWDLPLNKSDRIPIGSFADFILPDKLTLSANTDIDLLHLDKPPTFDVSGRLGGFAVDILKKSVVLHFKPFEFNGGSGRSAHFSADLESVEIGAMLAFLTVLAAYFQAQSGDTPTDASDVALLNGPYVIPRTEGPGIKAGYRISIGAAQIGTLAILGMNFDAHCEMPFDGKKGAVRISLASPDAPFLITCAPYGGRGHFVAESGPGQGVKFDIGFQWGGAAAISFGPLQGQAFLMVGFRMVNQPGGFEFSGFFIAAFEGHVACFGVAGSFVVSMRYMNNKMKGEATLTFEFSCGPAKIKYRVGVGHDAGGSMGDQAWLEPAPGEPRVMLAGGRPLPAVAASHVPALLEDWQAYRKRYDFGIRAAGRRRRR